MEETIVAVVVEMNFREGAGVKALEALRPLVAAAGKDAGTLTYALHTERKSPDRIWFYERYASIEALREHGQDEQLKRVLNELEPLMDGPPVLRQLTPVAAVGLPGMI